MTDIQDDCKTADPKDQNVCAHPDCKTPLDQEHFCFGCNFFICDECDTQYPMGPHVVIDHWEQE